MFIGIYNGENILMKKPVYEIKFLNNVENVLNVLPSQQIMQKVGIKR
jgi:hypothetical protein